MNKVDLLFILDVTGSMGGLIDAAQRRMKEILQSLSEKHNVDLRVGLSLYRDHPPQDHSFVTVVADLATIEKTKKRIDLITVSGGGDTPEAVLDGIIDGIKGMSWRAGSRRIAFLIADAYAHGMCPEDVEPGVCLCGKTWGDAIFVAEQHRVTIYGISMGGTLTSENFKLIANFTGGVMVETPDAMTAILEALNSELENLNLDSAVMELLSEGRSPEQIQKMLNIDREALSASEGRTAQLG